MVNWEDFEHIHVVKKMKEIVGNWFGVDIIFVDDKGRIRNFSEGQKKLWNNTLMANVFDKKANYEFLCRYAEKEAFFLAKNEVQEHEFEFIPGLKGVSFPIIIDREFIGAVISFCYKPKEGAKAGKKYFIQMAELGLEKADATKAFQAVKSITQPELNYFKELSNLVAQEIVTLHTEISVREDRIKELNNELGGRHKYDSMIGKSKPMQDLYSLLDKIKGTESMVLVQGENGTGKELIAKAIHYNSSRKDNVFLAINCAAFNDNLLESELFGHLKGSFTGAVKDRKGYFESANGGTLFMDEIGDISQAMQVKLLRVLQDGTYTPVGGTSQKKSKVRIIAATNRNLKQMVEKGEFRQDLYFRLNVIGVLVPPLKDRKEDLPLLVDHFLALSSNNKDIDTRKMSKRAMQKLYDYHWPGNIRELENEIERCTVLSGDEKVIVPEMLSPRIFEQVDRPKVPGTRVAGKLKDALEEMEKKMIREGLRRCGWNKSKLAKELGISRAGLLMKIDKYNLDKRTYTRSEANFDSTGSGGKR